MTPPLQAVREARRGTAVPLLALLVGGLALALVTALPFVSPPASPWLALLAAGVGLALGLAFAFSTRGGARRDAGLRETVEALRRSEAELQERERRLRFVLEAGGLGHWRLDLATHRLECSDSCKANLGVPPETDLSSYEALRALVHPEDRPAMEQAVERAIATRGDCSAEYRVQGAGGARWVLARARVLSAPDGTPLAMLGTMLDLSEHKRAEAALKESEERFRNMADHAPVILWVTDASGACTYLSRQWYEFTGQREEAALGLGWLDAVHPKDADRAAEHFLTSNAEHLPFRFEYRLRRKDGEYRWAIDSAVPRHGPGGEFLGYIGSVIDITERKRAEEERLRLMKDLSGERARLQTVLDNIPVGVLLAEAPGGQIVLGNAQVKHLLRHPVIPSPGLEASGDWVATHPDGRPVEAHEWPLARALKGESVRGEDFLYHRADGSSVWLRIGGAPLRNLRGEVIGGVAAFHDIDREKEAEARLRLLAEASTALTSSLDPEPALQKLAELVIPLLGDGCAVDLLEPDGSLRRVAVAHPREEQARVLRELGRFQFADGAVTAYLANAIRTGEPVWAPRLTEGWVDRATQDPKHRALLQELGASSFMIVPLMARGRTLGTLCFIHGESGRSHGAEELTLARDVARRAALAVDNARLYREARDAVRLRDEFLSVASHELKTPLTPLLLKLEMLKRAAVNAPDRRVPSDTLIKQVEVAGRQVHKLAGLVNDLLDVSRLMQGRLRLELAEVDLGDVVREVTTELAPEAARVGCAIHLALDAGVVGQWDPQRMAQVVTNLLTNALKYGPGHPVHVTLGSSDGKARLAVRDQGIGIAPEAQARIFDKFERAVSERHYGGLGLGLYISRQIVEGHGGTIQVESTPGQGATFTVEVPLRPPGA